MDESDMIRVGEPLPQIGSVRAVGSLAVAVTWCDGLRAGVTETVDLSPLIRAYAVYRSLRDDPDLFGTVHVVDGGQAVAWGPNDGRHVDVELGDDGFDAILDMSATAIEHLVMQAPSKADVMA